MSQITNAYSRNFRTLIQQQDGEPEITSSDSSIERLNFCLKHELVQFLHEHKRKDGSREIVLTHDVVNELTRDKDNIEGITTMEDLAKELPGFEFTSRKVGGKTHRVIAGRYGDMVKFLESDIIDE